MDKKEIQFDEVKFEDKEEEQKQEQQELKIKIEASGKLRRLFTNVPQEKLMNKSVSKLSRTNTCIDTKNFDDVQEDSVDAAPPSFRRQTTTRLSNISGLPILKEEFESESNIGLDIHHLDDDNLLYMYDSLALSTSNIKLMA